MCYIYLTKFLRENEYTILVIVTVFVQKPLNVSLLPFERFNGNSINFFLLIKYIILSHMHIF